MLDDTNRLQFANNKYTNSDYLSFCNDNSKDYFSDSTNDNSKMLDPSELKDLSLKLQKFIIPEKQSKLSLSRYQKQLNKEVNKAAENDVFTHEFLKNSSKSLRNMESSLSLIDIFTKTHNNFKSEQTPN
jgi:hypothetical protein